MGIWIKTKILLGILQGLKELVMWMDQVDWLIAGGIFTVCLTISMIALIIGEDK